MTPGVRALVGSLVTGPGRPASLTPEEFLDRAGATDGRSLALSTLQEAATDRSSDDVSRAVVLAEVFGVDERFVEPLVALATVPWHVSHEDVVTLLSRLADPRAVPALAELTDWVPEHLDWDENHALGVKAVRALAGIPGNGAAAALRGALGADGEPVRSRARIELERRGS